MKKILMIVSLPPPVHGSNVMNSYVVNSKKIRENYSVDVVNYSFVSQTNNIGSFSLKKIKLLFYHILIIIKKIIFNQPDIVYFPIVPYGGSFLRDALVVFIIKMFRIKLVYHLHGKGAALHYKKQKRIYDFVYRNTYVICLAKELVKDIPFYKGTPFILNNGIENFNIPNKTNHNDMPNILYLSNFIESKGILVLLDAISILSKKLPDRFTVTLIGAYQKKINKKFLNQYIKDKGIGFYINLVGPKYGDEKIKYLANADIFVFPTFFKNECFPLVLLEASQFSLPMVSTYEGGIPSIIQNGVNGFLTKQKDAKDLANKLELLIKDKILRKEMGRNAKKIYLEKYTFEKFETNLLKILNKI